MTSIDRLSITADRHLLISPYEMMPDWDGLVLKSDGSYAVIAECNDGFDDFTENLAWFGFYDYGQNSGVRLDFNPNNKNKKHIDEKYWNTVFKLLNGMVGTKRLTRIDIAFDVFDNEMKHYRNYKPGLKTVFHSRDREVETIYYGSRKSDKQIRQYNKQREQLVKGIRCGEQWRLEIQLRSKEIQNLGKHIESALENFKPMEWSHLEKAEDRLLMRGLDLTPEEYSELSKYNRTKVNKMRREAPMGDLTIELLDAYEKQKGNLKSELENYLDKFDIAF